MGTTCKRKKLYATAVKDMSVIEQNLDGEDNYTSTLMGEHKLSTHHGKVISNKHRSSR